MQGRKRKRENSKKRKETKNEYICCMFSDYNTHTITNNKTSEQLVKFIIFFSSLYEIYIYNKQKKLLLWLFSFV